MVALDVVLDEETDEELYNEKSYTFRYEGKHIKVFKESGESYQHVLLRLLGYILYYKKYHSIEVNPVFYQKYKSDLMALDYEGKPAFWGECGRVRWEVIEYIYRHTDVQEIVLIESEEYIETFLEIVKQKIPKKFLSRIKVINFLPDFVNEWLDPSDVVLYKDWYEIRTF